MIMRELPYKLIVYFMIVSTILISIGCAYFTPDAPPEVIEEATPPESDYPEEEF